MKRSTRSPKRVTRRVTAPEFTGVLVPEGPGPVSTSVWLSGNVVAFDPGARHPAAAFFVDGELVAASRIKLPGAYAKLALGKRAHEIAGLTRKWVDLEFFKATTSSDGIQGVVYELPKVYRGKKAIGDPNDLIMLAVIAGEVAGRFPGAEAFAVLPREWSQGTKKTTKGDPWDSSRGRRIAARLSPVERSRVQDTHDALDATGIGLYLLGRFEPTRAF